MLDTADAVSDFPTEHPQTRWWKFKKPRGTLLIESIAAIAVIEFALLAAPLIRRPAVVGSAQGGTVVVESIPAGASIAIDGQPRGTTPSTLTIKPGNYALSLTLGSVTREVPLVVSDGHTTQRVYFDEAESAPPLAPPISTTAATPAPAAVQTPTNAVGGWLSIASPVDLQLYEKDSFVGTSQAARIMLPVGRHVIDASNSALGFKTSMTVDIAAGRVSRFEPQMPNGTLNVNAIPWAEVAVDGKPLGPTPIANVSLAIGSHELVFTHPQLGERRETVIVTLNGVNRFSVNLNQR